MNIRFSKSCGYIVVLLICFPVTYAIFGNESFPTNWANVGDVDDLYKINQLEQRLATNKVVEETLKNNGKSYIMIEEMNKEGNEECTDRSINDFPNDLFTYEQRRHGAVALHAFLGFYCFLLTALVCNDYLLPSVDRICVKMNISTDIAGATFLATASSFPEMFVNVIGTFLTESDLGAGTVVGSAVFDTFATPACGALIALHAIPLEWKILLRDCTMYVISVVTLVIIMWDRRIRWYEATIMLVLLCSYLFLLFCGKSIMLCCAKIVRFNSESTTKLSNVDENSSPESSYKPRPQDNDTDMDRKESLNVHDLERQQQNVTDNTGNIENSDESVEQSMSEYLFAWPRERNMIIKFWFMFVWPLKFMLFATIPDIRVKHWKHWYPLTFIMSVVWIAITSYFISWMMTVIGDTVGIPDSIMGLTFLAAGGNMPEVASIIILAKQGDGNMAMSNTLGANILDILLCLGLPWTIKCLMTGRDVEIDSGALTYSVLSIVICIVVFYGVLAFYGFKLNKKVGLICLLLYTIFLIFAILVELNVFFFVNLPMCD